jgi:pimeloyl-ACP methyl ester carboxylesterase
MSTHSIIVYGIHLLGSSLQSFRPASRAAILHRLKLVGISVAALFALWTIGLVIVHALPRDPVSPAICLRPCTGNDGIIVFVHGWTTSPKAMAPIAESVRQIPQFINYRFYLWAYDASRFSNKDPTQLATDLVHDIRAWALPGTPVVLVGHSAGGLLVRRAYLDALSAKESWANSVTRIVLLAATNRGETAVSRSTILWIADTLARSYGVGAFIQSTYRGAPFVVNLRLEWIRTFLALRARPVVSQLLGTRDAVVGATDSADVLQFPDALEFSLPNTTHTSILDPSESKNYVADALTRFPSPPAAGQRAPTRTFKVMVVHGIRDYGERFVVLRDMLDNEARRLGFAAEGVMPRYSYFSALEFVNPLARHARLLDFADQYTELVAHAPIDAPVHFAGHSFGTYLMGRAITDYDQIRFDRVYLAGSVLSESFLATASAPVLGLRIHFLRNDIAAEDWPVGILCSALAQTGLADPLIGTAGFNGFTGLLDAQQSEERRYFNGGHGEALESYNLPTIVGWITNSDGNGGPYNADQVTQYLRQVQTPLLTERSGLWSFLSRNAGLLLILILMTVGYLLLAVRRPAVGAAAVLIIGWLLNVI